MAGSGQKLPLGKSLNDIAARKALDHIHMTGKALPCSIVKVTGSVVELKFEVGGGYTLPNVTIPIVESLYSRGGHQVGDKGFASAATVTHTNMSGLGPTSPPGLAEPANLAALAFHPIGNAAWPDTNATRVNQAKNGSIAQTLDGKNQAGGITPGVLLTAKGVSTILTPQMIAKLASLLGGSSTGGGGGAGASYGGNVAASSGTSRMNSLDLAYQYVQPLTGATVAIAANVVVTTIDPAGALAALTVTMPAAPVDSQVQIVSSTQAITALTLSGGTFSANAPTSFPAGGGRVWLQYQAASGNWVVL